MLWCRLDLYPEQGNITPQQQDITIISEKNKKKVLDILS